MSLSPNQYQDFHQHQRFLGGLRQQSPLIPDYGHLVRHYPFLNEHSAANQNIPPDHGIITVIVFGQ